MFSDVFKTTVIDHLWRSIGMNSRATHLKFVCPRMSHVISILQPGNCIFWPIKTLNRLVAASKLHKRGPTVHSLYIVSMVYKGMGKNVESEGAEYLSFALNTVPTTFHHVRESGIVIAQ